MRIGKQIGIVVLLLATLLGGCKKKKPIVLSPQATAPTIPLPSPTPTPEPIPAIPSTIPPPAKSEDQTAQDNAKPRIRHRKPHIGAQKSSAATPKPTPVVTPTPAAAPTPPTTTTATNRPPKNVIREGGVNAGTPQASATMANADDKQTTAQLLQNTENNLKILAANLSDDQKTMVTQIRVYIAQSRSATAEDDLVRAHNLALKAHLLSDELVKH